MKNKQMDWYEGELGSLYTKEETVFKVWAPSATNVRLKLFESGDGGEAYETYDMKAKEKGVWAYVVSGDLHRTYYTYEVTIDGKTAEAVDPYAKAAGVNGQRGMVVDLSTTDPDGWKKEAYKRVDHQTDAIIYELHVRDLSIHPDSGIENKGKFIGLIEEGTTNSTGLSTGLDHIKELGVTHIHLLPIYDYLTVDETKLDTPQYNWGYDPQNYNVPEGSYSTDPYNGEVRIRECKEMIQGLHKHGLGVIMDVVYNHVGYKDATLSNFETIVPNYYFRMNEDGSFSDGSACGNETASEKAMMRKFIVESVIYWAKEYQIDGFRFDLMGLHDIETMNLIRTELDKIDPKIIIYGEGWTGDDTPLPESERAIKKNVPKFNSRIAAFSDDIRDAVKGCVFEETEAGFVNGTKEDSLAMAESIKFGVVASTKHPQINYDKILYTDKAWANEPSQTVTYASAHDNHTLWDKIGLCAPDASQEEKIKMNKFAAAIVLTSQGISFIHAGEEMLRTKGGHENSYKSPDSVNQFVWDRKDIYPQVFEYYKGLIEIRKSHPAFRMTKTKQIKENLKFIDMPDKSMVGYMIDGKALGDSWHTIVVIHNGSKVKQDVELPGKGWTVFVNSEKAGLEPLERYEGDRIRVKENSTCVLVNQIY